MRWFSLLLIVFLTSCHQQDDIQQVKKQSGAKHSSPHHVSFLDRARLNKPRTLSTTPTEKDGAPSGLFPAFFQVFKPKDEPLSRYGNPGSYRVNGQNYNVMTSAKGYRARGLASWYGTKFHAKRTSSGEGYNMYALTAAHRTLPLPTYVRVKNLSNGRVAIVKVNDRGPFHSNRIIDLSYAAAVKLGLFPKGTAMVEIEALNVQPKGKSHIAQYYVQAGAFESRALADTMRRKLTKMTSAKVFVERYQRRYLVKAGPFSNRQMTERLKSALQRQGVKGAFSLLQ